METMVLTNISQPCHFPFEPGREMEITNWAVRTVQSERYPRWLNQPSRHKPRDPVGKGLRRLEKIFIGQPAVVT